MTVGAPPLVTVFNSAQAERERGLVLFLPGLSGNNRMWDPVVAELLDDQFDLAYGSPILSHPAFGGARPSVVELGCAMAEQLKADGRKDVVVVTHSVGAFVAMAIANAAPEIVKSLVVVNGGLTSVARFIDSPVHQLIRHPASALAYLRLFVLVGAPMPRAIKRAIASRRWSSKAVVGNLVSESALQSREQRDALILEAGKAETVQSLWQNRHHWHEFEASAHEIRTPVHFLVGDRDPMTSEHDTRTMASLLPHARITVLKGIGHAAPLEATEQVTAAVRAAVAG